MSTVRLLAEALGLDQARREAFLVAASAGRDAPARSLDLPLGLQVPPTPLIGRDDLVMRACAALARPDVRLLTLTGAPGVGKTRVALEVATRQTGERPDGVFVAGLAGLSDANEVAPALQHVLGAREQGRQGPTEAITTRCRDRELLLVVDNLEHLPAAVPVLVELLVSCPGVQVLATSRVSLSARLEHELPVPPLPLPERDEDLSQLDASSAAPAVALFVERATAAAPTFRLTSSNVAAVVAICRRLDGLPLAIELAAPWVKLLTPGLLLERLEQRLPMLVSRGSDLPDRQRTMRTALAWSCSLLAPEPLAVFRRLAVFAGTASIEAVEAVCPAAGELRDAPLLSLAVLADHSLVSRQSDPQQSARVSMLETVREHARDLLVEAGEAAATARAHAEYYAALAEEAEQQLQGPAQNCWLQRLEWEHDNYRAALEWAADSGHVELGLRTAHHLYNFWYMRGHRHEGRSWMERLLATAAEVPSEIRARALLSAGKLAWLLGSFGPAHERLAESLGLFRACGDRWGTANALNGIGLLASAQGEYRRAAGLFEEALCLQREIDYRQGAAANLNNLAAALKELGEAERAKRLYAESIALRRELGDTHGTAMTLINLGNLLRIEGDLRAAAAALEEAVSVGRELDAPRALAAALRHLGDVARDRRDVGPARACYEESLRLFARGDDQEGIANGLERMAWVLHSTGSGLLAARLLGAAARLRQVMGAPARPADAAAAERVRSLLHEQLADAFTPAFKGGATLSVEEAIAEALARFDG